MLRHIGLCVWLTIKEGVKPVGYMLIVFGVFAVGMIAMNAYVPDEQTQMMILLGVLLIMLIGMFVQAVHNKCKEL